MSELQDPESPDEQKIGAVDPVFPAGDVSPDADDGNALIIQQLEKKFQHRYTEDDEDYMNVVKKPLSPPPCVHPWHGGSRNRSGRSHSYGRSSDDRRWQDRSRSSSGYRDRERNRDDQRGSYDRGRSYGDQQGGYRDRERSREGDRSYRRY